MSHLKRTASTQASCSARRARIGLDIIQRKIGVARRLGEPPLEISHGPLVDEIIAVEHAGNALAMDRRREQFGQRGRDRDDKRLFDDKAHIGLDREFRRRERPAARYHIVARQPQPVGQRQPAFDASGFLAEPVMIVQTVDPFAAQLAVVHPADERGVLARNPFLIAVAI